MFVYATKIAITLLVICLSIYAWKDWFISLCGLILYTAIMKNEYAPASLGYIIQGLNLWNILFINILLSWLVNRERQGLIWDMPRIINVFLVLFVCVRLIGFAWMILDRSHIEGYPVRYLINDDLINFTKWPLLGLLLFDGCRTHLRTNIALVCVLLFFALFTVQIVKSVPSDVVLTGRMQARDHLRGEVGLSINGAGKMMSGVPWAMLAVLPLMKKRKYRFLMLGVSIASFYSVALTGSRAGYIGCGVTGVFLCFLRWRRYLLLLPVVGLIMAIALPGARDRLLTGFGETDVAGQGFTDIYEVTSGRSALWPLVVSKIGESPVFGFGQRGMQRTGLQERATIQEIDISSAGHPHNAYLEVLIDNGLIGFIVIVGFHMLVLLYSARLFIDRGDPLFTATGGVCLAILTSYLVAYMGGQSFYAEFMDVGFWCAIGVMLRVYLIRKAIIPEWNQAQDVNMLFARKIVAAQAPLMWIRL